MAGLPRHDSGNRHPVQARTPWRGRAQLPWPNAHYYLLGEMKYFQKVFEIKWNINEPIIKLVFVLLFRHFRHVMTVSCGFAGSTQLMSHHVRHPQRFDLSMLRRVPPHHHLGLLAFGFWRLGSVPCACVCVPQCARVDLLLL